MSEEESIKEMIGSALSTIESINELPKLSKKNMKELKNALKILSDSAEQLIKIATDAKTKRSYMRGIAIMDQFVADISEQFSIK